MSLDYFPKSSAKEVVAKTHLCTGAEPQAHSHFFNNIGQFGSLDQDGNQVDDGTYELVGDHVLHISDGTFRYRIENGKTLYLHPVISAADRRRALAHPLRFSTAGWEVAVSYEGHPWKRVDCAGWC
ncbi:MAG: hypothetical protein QOH90_1562 [Actinomycetota bacterium]|jgi:hypothetical protein|nr:hypothetical protein [Actinomycetota bacterium]